MWNAFKAMKFCEMQCNGCVNFLGQVNSNNLYNLVNKHSLQRFHYSFISFKTDTLFNFSVSAFKVEHTVVNKLKL